MCGGTARRGETLCGLKRAVDFTDLTAHADVRCKANLMAVNVLAWALPTGGKAHSIHPNNQPVRRSLLCEL